MRTGFLIFGVSFCFMAQSTYGAEKRATSVTPSNTKSPPAVQGRPSPKSGANRVTKHTDAYNPHPERGPHVDLKITPPEKRGKDMMVLVEIYNRAKVFLSVVRFDITLKNHDAQDISSTISVEDISPGWSVPRWIKVPGSGKLPPIDAVEVSNISMFDKDAKEVKLKIYSDLIKE